MTIKQFLQGLTTPKDSVPRELPEPKAGGAVAGLVLASAVGRSTTEAVLLAAPPVVAAAAAAYGAQQGLRDREGA